MKTTLCLTLLFLTGKLVAAEPSVWELARPVIRPYGAPKYSDVCFSSRWERPRDGADPLDSFAAARAFHATQWVWLYPDAHHDFKGYLSRIKASGARANCAVNNTLPDAPDRKTFEKGRVMNLGGQTVAPKFMKGWPVKAGCSIHPDFFRIYVDEGKRLLDCGADSIQDDSMSLNDSAQYFGGCFCPACMEGFRSWLGTRLKPADWQRLAIADGGEHFDYRAYLLAAGTPADDGDGQWRGDPELKQLFLRFQHEGVVSFYRRAHEAWNAYAGRRVPCTRNEYKDMITWSGPPLFDYGITEWYGLPNVEAFWNIARIARDKDTSFILTYARPDVAGNRLAIAAAYAGGMSIAAPWDVFTGSATPRVFGTAAEYGDLFGFVRGVAPWLDGYEDAGSCSVESHDSRWGTAPLLHLVGTENVHAAVRAKPGMTGNPVVVHLVDSSPAPQAFKVALDLSRLGGQPVKATLLEPVPFDAVAHEKAAAEGSFNALVKQTELSAGEKTLLSIPPLTSNWGILILTPLQSTNLTPQPFFRGTSLSFEDHLDFSLGVPGNGTAVHYTLDNSEPGPTSAKVTDTPITIRENSRLRAVTLRDGKRGSELNLDLRKLPRFDFEHDDSLALWCVAVDLKGTHGDGQPVETWTARRGPPLGSLAGRILPNGRPVSPPRFESSQEPFPLVRFNGVDEGLSLPRFVSENLNAGFTLFMVTRSDDKDFGLCGNGELGGGGIPRLYMTRDLMIVNTLDDRIINATNPGKIEGHVFQWDGRSRLSAAKCGQNLMTRTCDPVTSFGKAASLAIPLWYANRNHAGDLFELIVFKRPLSDDERQAVERMLIRKYGLR